MPAKQPDALPEFQRVQRQLAGHIRNPELTPAPEGLEDRRIAIYRDLFFNNIKNFISNNFPVMRKLYSDQAWTSLIRDFFTRHEAHTPLFPELPREFLQFIEQRQQEDNNDPPFLLELAHYEWIELALSLDENELDSIPHDREGNLIEGRPVRSPLAWLMTYQFPVHQIKPSFRPQKAPAQPTYLVIYREPDDQVKFSEINAVSARLLQLMTDQPELTGRQLLSQLAGELNAPNVDAIIEAGSKILSDFRDRHIVLGTHT